MNKYKEAFWNIDCKIISGKGAGQSYVNGQYKYDSRAILELVNKATPKKAKIEKHPYSIDYESSLVDKYFCPNCNQYLREVAGYHLNKNYCPRCGQALDWGDEE